MSDGNETNTGYEPARYRQRKIIRYEELPADPPIESGEDALFVPYKLYIDRDLALKYAKVVEVIEVDDDTDVAHVREKGKKKALVLTTKYSNLKRFNAHDDIEEVYVPPKYPDLLDDE